MKQAITVNQLANIIMGIKGAKFATITTTTPVKMNKTGNPFYDKVLKTCTTNVTLGFNYENSVNAQRQREGNNETFEAQPRKWGMRINGTTVVTHNGMLYVEAKVNHAPKDTTYRHVDGSVINKADIEQFMQKASKSSRQETDKEIVLRDYKLMSIDAINIDGQQYQIVK